MKQKKKRFSRFLCVAAAAILGVTGLQLGTLPTTAEANRPLGDLNRDGVVSVADVVVLEKALLNITPLSEAEDPEIVTYADLNTDGKVNGFDLALLRQKLLNDEETLPSVPTETTTPVVTTTEATTEETTTISTTSTKKTTGKTQKTTTSTTETTTTTTTRENTTSTAKSTTTTKTTSSTTMSTTTSTTTTTATTTLASFIQSPISLVGLYKNLPSQGSASLVIFYVDFPDCSYSSSADLTSAEITEIAFGDEDKSDTNYPFDSMSAFYSRSSKGSMELSGTAIRYTAKENISSYSSNKAKLVEECYDAFKNSVDFSQYDGDGDGRIDATLISVPTSAGDSDWWPCAGGFGDDSYKVDGKTLGHLITGNAQIESSSDYAYFNSSYLHEMGHCMGLPDYYLYYTDDWDSMLGEGGAELMDGDAYSDFGAFSKLMLGWYRENQIQVYDTSDSSPQTFTLTNAQTEEGNCLIIPYGTLSSTYTDSEYFVLEYTTLEENNSAVAGYWWQDTPSSGVRIYHVKTDVYDNGWWKFLKYQNGSEFTDTDGDGTADDQGIRLIRLVGSDTSSSIFRTGSVISSSTSGFGWYDSSENESIDPGVSIRIGNLSDGSYTVTVTKN